jgi:hypothetical protein
MSQTKAELIQTVKQGTVSLGDADSSHSIKLKAPATVAADRTWTMPATDPTAEQVLRGNASTPTTLEWGTITGGVGSDAQNNTVGGENAGNALDADTLGNTLFGENAGTSYQIREIIITALVMNQVKSLNFRKLQYCGGI